LPPKDIKLLVKVLTGFPSVYIRVKPLAMVVIPRVAIKGGIDVKAITLPFIRPKIPPTINAASTGTINGNSPKLGKNLWLH